MGLDSFLVAFEPDGDALLRRISKHIDDGTLQHIAELDLVSNDSLGTAQASRSFLAGRISAGGKAIYPWQISSGTRISPYVGLYVDWCFSSDNALPVAAPLVGIQNGWSARVTTGITTTMSSGLTVSVGGEFGGLGAGYEVSSANAQVSWPF